MLFISILAVIFLSLRFPRNFSISLLNRNLIESAVIKVFSDVSYNIRPGLFSLDDYIAQKIFSFNRIF